MPNSSHKLEFKIFVDDTNVFMSARDLNTLECLMNSDLSKVKTLCDWNKLFINMYKFYDYQILKEKRFSS